jgi:hypothetical protein
MGEWRGARILMMVAVGVAALGGSSCGGGSGAPAGKHDGGAAGQDGGGTGRDAGVAGQDGDATDAALCPVPGELTAEPGLRQVALDGGVPLGQYAYAVAVARCSYWSRCYALSAYVANDCVDQLTNNDNSFEYPPSGTTIRYFDPSDALLQAAAAGVVRYDPQRESQCFAAELAEGCAESDLFENIPACVGVFTCPPGADGGSGPVDGGAVDGGATCAQLVGWYNQPLKTCSTDQDCAGVDAAPQGPDCVAGICSQSRCGIFPVACTSFAAVGQPCTANAFSVLNSSSAPTGLCAPGLGCQGWTRDGGLGTCVVPVDVGGTCTDDSNCKPGLACACGSCEIPPATGPCVNNLCEVGVAYCDRVSNTCRPVRPLNASCDGATDSCAPGLTCDITYRTCQPQP